MGPELVFGCICFLVSAFVGLLLLSVIVRAAVWIANKCLGGSGGPVRRSSYEDDWDDDYDQPVRRRSSAIPEPNLFKGVGIALLVMIAQFIVGIVIAVVLGAAGGGFRGGNNPFGPQPGGDPVMQLLANGISLATGFLIWTSLLTAMLPTSFGRAVLVTVFIYLILFAIGIVIVGALLVAGIGMAGLR